MQTGSYSRLSTLNSELSLRNLPGKARPGIACPTQLRQAASEGTSDSWWKECLHVVQASRGGIAASSVVECQEVLPALPGRAGAGIVKQICFRCEPLQNCHHDFWPRRSASLHTGILFRRSRSVVVIFQYKLRHKHRAVKIRERIAETLRVMHVAQCVEVGRRIFADAQQEA